MRARLHAGRGQSHSLSLFMAIVLESRGSAGGSEGLSIISWFAYLKLTTLHVRERTSVLLSNGGMRYCYFQPDTAGLPSSCTS